jgi:hypothetical protein
MGSAVAPGKGLSNSNHSTSDAARKEHQEMLWTIAAVLVVLWLLGIVSAYTMGGFIHVLLVMALVVVVIQLIQGRKLL